MTSIYLILLTEVIYLNTLLKFFSSINITSKLSIFYNHTEHPKRLTSYYTLPFSTKTFFIYDTTIIYYDFRQNTSPIDDNKKKISHWLYQ